MSGEFERPDFEQRTVSAATAPRLQTTGASSPFAMGAALRTPDDDKRMTDLVPKAPRNRGASDLPARLLQSLEACGPLNGAQVAKALGIERAHASVLCRNCVARGLVVRVTEGNAKDGTQVTFGLPPGGARRARREATEAPKSTGAMTGFKSWLSKRGEGSEEGSPRKKRSRAPVAVSAPVTPTALHQEQPLPALRYALFNDGSLRIESGDSALVLPPAQSSELLAYLQRVSVVLGGRDGR